MANQVFDLEKENSKLKKAFESLKTRFEKLEALVSPNAKQSADLASDDSSDISR